MPVPSIDDVLAAAYRSWSLTGRSSVPDFDITAYDRASLEARLAELQQINGDAGRTRCIVSRTQALWLEQALA